WPWISPALWSPFWIAVVKLPSGEQETEHVQKKPALDISTRRAAESFKISRQEAFTGRNHKEANVRLSGTRNHVLDEVAVARGVDDSVMPPLRLPTTSQPPKQLLGGAGDGHTAGALLLLTVHVEGKSERGLAKRVGLLPQLLHFTLRNSWLNAAESRPAWLAHAPRARKQGAFICAGEGATRRAARIKPPFPAARRPHGPHRARSGLTSELEQEAAGGGGLPGVDMAADDDGQVLFVGHFFRCSNLFFADFPGAAWVSFCRTPHELSAERPGVAAGSAERPGAARTVRFSAAAAAAAFSAAAPFCCRPRSRHRCCASLPPPFAAAAVRRRRLRRRRRLPPPAPVAPASLRHPQLFGFAPASLGSTSPSAPVAFRLRPAPSAGFDASLSPSDASPSHRPKLRFRRPTPRLRTVRRFAFAVRRFAFRNCPTLRLHTVRRLAITP
ncbi:MAG: hypothetical protein BJ554DRAFT_1448, partial [Olpidium bornovanus]